MLFYKPVIGEPVRRLLTNLPNQIIRPSVPSHFAEASMKGRLTALALYPKAPDLDGYSHHSCDQIRGVHGLLYFIN